MRSTRYACQILVTLEFSRRIFEKILKYQIFMKIRPVGSEVFREDGQTRRSLIVAF